MLEHAYAQLKESLPSRRYKEMASALSVSRPLPQSNKRWVLITVQAVLQLLAPMQPLKGITSVAELFRDAEDARKVVQEKVAAEMDAL